MRFQVRTEVQGHFRDVFAAFDRDLLEFLIPSFPPVKLTRWDGHIVGAEVHAQVGLAPLANTFQVKIIERVETNEAAWFVDQGIKMPFPISEWIHKHQVEYLTESTSVIVDDVQFTTSPRILATGMKQFIQASMNARAPLYQQYFTDLQ